MSDWYTDPHSENTSSPQEPQTPPTADNPSPASPEPPVTPPANGWSSDAPSGSWSNPVTPPSPPTPPTPPSYSAPNGWQSPGGGYQSPNSPNSPYGWTPQPAPAPQKPPKKKNGTGVLIAVLAVVAVVCVAASLILLSPGMKTEQSGGSTTPSTSSGSADPGNKINEHAPSIVTEDPQEEGLSSRDIVNANLNSTVIIKMYNTASSSFFFQNTDGDEEVGEATGIVWTADGYIITNAHCVYDEDTRKVYSRIEVDLYDGTVFESATVVGYDTATDLAVLKVDAENLSPASFGDSSALAMGDRVLALGNNGGLGWTVTQGIVSGLARDVYEETNYAIKCLQVDAVINPGNSGGPLLNASGQVIAINSAKITATGYEGIGFSIPINEASEILEDLVTYGYVKGRIMLGIEGQTFNQYSSYEGFLITNIGNPSSFAGTNVQAGDIITHVNGTRVKSYAEMREQITAYHVGDQVTITLIRINRNSRSVDTFDVTITLIENDGSV